MECSHHFPSFGHFEKDLGRFGQKKAVFGPKWHFLKLGCITRDTRSRPQPLSLWLGLGVIVLHIHGYHPRKFQPNPKQHYRVCSFHACLLLLLLAACCFAKLGRSTLGPKKGNKTKTGSTSSVTLTLALALTLG